MVIIDYSILFYRFHYKVKPEELQQCIKDKVDMLCFELQDYDVALTVDFGESFRKKLYPQYKANRPDKTAIKKSYYRLLDLLDYKHYYCDGLEADDLCYILAIEHYDKEPIIVSEDQDMHQIIRDDIRLYKPFQKTFYTGDWFADVEEKIFLGDTSDNIPRSAGYGLGPKTFKLIVEKAESDSDKLFDMIHLAYPCNINQYDLNVKLIEFNYDQYLDYPKFEKYIKEL